MDLLNIAQFKNTDDDIHARLIRLERLAALGRLVSGIAHELNTPIGAIVSASASAVDATRNRLSEVLKYFAKLPEGERELYVSVVAEGLAHAGELDRVVKRKERKALAGTLAACGVGEAESAAELIADLGVEKIVLASGSMLRNPELKNILSRARDLVGIGKMAEVISVASGKAARVVDAVRAYLTGRRYDGEPGFDLKEEIETILTLYHNRIKHNVALKKDYDEIGLIPGDRALLNLVWICLIDNALEAMNCDGSLEIGIKQEGGWALVSLTDSGSGIPDSIGKRVFEPLFSTKSPAERTGIGLDTCARIVRAHGGEIGFESNPGRTRFTVRLKTIPADG